MSGKKRKILSERKDLIYFKLIKLVCCFPNQGIGVLEDIHLVTINQNGGFTKIWFSLKTVFTPLVLAGLVWYWNRVKAQGRPPALLEKMILFLGVAIEFLNCE